MAEARLVGDAEVTLGGNADSAIAPRLASFVTDLHEQLVKAARRRVKIDIRALDQLDAACFDVLVRWLGMVGELPPDQRYQLHFTSDAAIPWQQRSLHALSGSAGDLVTLDG